MRERNVLVPDLTEKVDSVRSREERRSDRVHGRIAPTLFHMIRTIWSVVVFSVKRGGVRG